MYEKYTILVIEVTYQSLDSIDTVSKALYDGQFLTDMIEPILVMMVRWLYRQSSSVVDSLFMLSRFIYIE